MSNTLTSWKEIAQHLGKGVRTAQRWEREMGLPVRRPQNKASGIVAASTEELDAWMRTAFQRKSETDLAVLRRELAEVKAENALLRAKIAGLEKPGPLPEFNSENKVGDEEAVWTKCFQAMERSISLRLSCAELIDLSRSLKMLREMRRDHPAWPYIH